MAKSGLALTLGGIEVGILVNACVFGISMIRACICPVEVLRVGLSSVLSELVNYYHARFNDSVSVLPLRSSPWSLPSRCTLIFTVEDQVHTS